MRSRALLTKGKTINAICGHCKAKIKYQVETDDMEMDLEKEMEMEMEMEKEFNITIIHKRPQDAEGKGSESNGKTHTYKQAISMVLKQLIEKDEKDVRVIGIKIEAIT